MGMARVLYCPQPKGEFIKEEAAIMTSINVMMMCKSMDMAVMRMPMMMCCAKNACCRPALHI